MSNKIPHILHVFPSFGRGGVPIKICHSINYFGKKARHTIISTNNDYGSEDIIIDGLFVAIDKSHHDTRGSLFSRLNKFRSYLRNANANLIITYNWGSVEWALANSFGPILPHIHVESGFGPEEVDGTIARRDLFRRLALRNIDFLSVPSTTLIKIARTKWKIPETKIKYIPNGVDLDKFSSIDEHFQLYGLERTPNEIIVGTIAPLRPEKNISRLIRCFAQILKAAPNTNSRLVIIGEGVERKKLEALTKDLNINDKVVFTGYVSEVASALAQINIFAISSDTEQMPNAVNEAMAAGLPVVGLAVGDVKHMVSEENKDFIAPAGDDETFEQNLKKLINDSAAQRSIGQSNLIHVKTNYDRLDMYQKYAQLWGIH